MADEAIDVVGVGNAIVDVISHSTDEFLVDNGLTKGSMALIDADRAVELYGRMGPGVESSGGSAANTIAGLASFGAEVAYIGKVRDDQLGAVFGHDIRSLGVRFDVAAASSGPPTARSLILVTPDAQRTMNTFLGASAHLTPDDIDEDVVAGCRVVYCEGYLWDADHAKAAIREAMGLADRHGGQVAFALSDGFCVDRHRAEFLELCSGPVDILFANEAEILSLYEVDEFDEALQRARADVEVACLTLGENGSVIVAGEEVHVIDAHPVEAVVDTTGAGDLYASGFLYGLIAGHDLATCGRLASIASAEVITHVGARPLVPLRELAADALG